MNNTVNQIPVATTNQTGVPAPQAPTRNGGDVSAQEAPATHQHNEDRQSQTSQPDRENKSAATETGPQPEARNKRRRKAVAAAGVESPFAAVMKRLSDGTIQGQKPPDTTASGTLPPKATVKAAGAKPSAVVLPAEVDIKRSVVGTTVGQAQGTGLAKPNTQKVLSQTPKQAAEADARPSKTLDGGADLRAVSQNHVTRPQTSPVSQDASAVQTTTANLTAETARVAGTTPQKAPGAQVNSSQQATAPASATPGASASGEAGSDAVQSPAIIASSPVLTEAGIVADGPKASNKTEPSATRDGYFVQILSETQGADGPDGLEVVQTVQPTAPTVGAANGTAESPPLTEAEDADGPAPVGLQITRAVRGRALRPGQQIVIRLNPPELGSVRIALRTVGNELRGMVTVDNPRTFTSLQHETPALVDRLSGADIRVTRMEVILNDNDASTGSGSHGSGPEANEAALQDGRQEQDPAQQDASTDARGEGDDPEGAFADAPRPTVVSNESINVWI